MSKEVKRYAERDAYELDKAGNYYCRHVSAMTGEGLHSKSDIAAELGWRDMQIDALLADNELSKQLINAASGQSQSSLAYIEKLTAERDALIAERDAMKAALIESRQVIATALRTGAPDWFETDEDIAGHHTIKRIDAAMQGAQP